MKKHLIVAAVALCTAGVSYAKDGDSGSGKDLGKALGQKVAAAKDAVGAKADAAKADATGGGGEPAAVDQALKKYYGDAKTKVFNSWDSNGEKVYEASVDTKDGQSTAIVTENGEIVSAGTPVATSALPAAVKDVSEGLFQSPAKDVDQYTKTYYFVNVQAGQGVYELKFDATGKLLDTRSYAQAARQGGGAKEAERPKESVAHNLAAAAQKDFAGTVANDVHTWGNAPGYYVVTLHKGKEPGWVVMDEMGAFYSSRIPVEQSKLPAGVAKSLQSHFKPDQVKTVLRGDERVYRVEQNVGGEKVVMLVHPNGDVMSVQTQGTPKAK